MNIAEKSINIDKNRWNKKTIKIDKNRWNIYENVWKIYKNRWNRYIRGQKTFHAYKINAKVQKEAPDMRIVVFLERGSFFLTPYITNESLLEAKSNFGVQMNIKNGPKSYEKLPLTTTKIIDFHCFFVFQLNRGIRDDCRHGCGLGGVQKRKCWKSIGFSMFFASARYLAVDFILLIRPSNLQKSVPRASIPASFL